MIAMDDLLSTAVRTLLSIAPGDQIEARDPRKNHWRGTVEVVDPDNGVLWIQTVDGERKLIDIWEHQISRLSAPLKPAAAILVLLLRVH